MPLILRYQLPGRRAGERYRRPKQLGGNTLFSDKWWIIAANNSADPHFLVFISDSLDPDRLRWEVHENTASPFPPSPDRAFLARLAPSVEAAMEDAWTAANAGHLAAVLRRTKLARVDW